VGGEVEEKAAEAGGAEADGDGEEVFFAATATVEEDEGGVVFDAGRREGEAALLELGAQEGAALVECAFRIRAAEQGGVPSLRVKGAMVMPWEAGALRMTWW
jgi:hypothetical protein